MPTPPRGRHQRRPREELPDDTASPSAGALRHPRGQAGAILVAVTFRCSRGISPTLAASLGAPFFFRSRVLFPRTHAAHTPPREGHGCVRTARPGQNRPLLGCMAGRDGASASGKCAPRDSARSRREQGTRGRSSAWPRPHAAPPGGLLEARGILALNGASQPRKELCSQAGKKHRRALDKHSRETRNQMKTKTDQHHGVRQKQCLEGN